MSFDTFFCIPALRALRLGVMINKMFSRKLAKGVIL